MRRALPTNLATGPPSVVVYAGFTLVSVEIVAEEDVIEASACIEKVCRESIGEAVVPAFTATFVDDSGEQPRKFGIVALYFSHSMRSNARAAVNHH